MLQHYLVVRFRFVVFFTRHLGHSAPNIGRQKVGVRLNRLVCHLRQSAHIIAPRRDLGQPAGSIDIAGVDLVSLTQTTFSSRRISLGHRDLGQQELNQQIVRIVFSRFLHQGVRIVKFAGVCQQHCIQHLHLGIAGISLGQLSCNRARFVVLPLIEEKPGIGELDPKVLWVFRVQLGERRFCAVCLSCAAIKLSKQLRRRRVLGHVRDCLNESLLRFIFVTCMNVEFGERLAWFQFCGGDCNRSG